MKFLKPIVGQWYVNRDTDGMFEIVSVDDATGAVELQDYEGTLDEIDADEWLALNIEEIDPPEDLIGIFDITEEDDIDVSAHRDERRFDRSSSGFRAAWQTEVD